LCRCLQVTRSGFYAWARRPESTRVQEDRRLKVLIHTSFAGSRGYYGSPRIHDDLREWKERVSRKRIIRLMQEERLQARVRKRYKVTTDSDHDQPIAANLLQQDFTAERPNQRWVGDTTELVIGESGDAVSRRRARSLFTIRRGLGGQRLQRPAPDDQRTRDGAEASPAGRRAVASQ
jgi:putative transposase